MSEQVIKDSVRKLVNDYGYTQAFIALSDDVGQQSMMMAVGKNEKHDGVSNEKFLMDVAASLLCYGFKIPMDEVEAFLSKYFEGIKLADANSE